MIKIKSIRLAVSYAISKGLQERNRFMPFRVPTAQRGKVTPKLLKMTKLNYSSQFSMAELRKL